MYASECNFSFCRILSFVNCNQPSLNPKRRHHGAASPTGLSKSNSSNMWYKQNGTTGNLEGSSSLTYISQKNASEHAEVSSRILHNSWKNKWGVR